jgi:predicted RNase H-like HicB family nuclease
MKYVAIIQPSSRGLSKSFSAYSPDIPGCLAKGTTEENAVQALREVIACRIETLTAGGFEIPKSYCKARIIEIAPPTEK